MQDYWGQQPKFLELKKKNEFVFAVTMLEAMWRMLGIGIKNEGQVWEYVPAFLRAKRIKK